jgi:chemotaxis response regulator CheB
LRDHEGRKLLTSVILVSFYTKSGKLSRDYEYVICPYGYYSQVIPMPNYAKTLPNQIAPKTKLDHPASITDSSNNDFMIVAIGASAGGLEAASKLMDALTDQLGEDHSNIAFILVQHLDPSHDSLLVELLSKHTKMVVTQAAEGDKLTPNHIYIIAPGTYLSRRFNSEVHNLIDRL